MKKAFSLMELITVLIIIAILSAIAIPRYGRTVERSRQAEAIGILGAMRGAQLRFAAENSGAFTTDPGDLDIDLPVGGSGRFFVYVLLGGGPNLAQATRNGVQQTAGSDDYELIIEEDGDIRCGSSDCAGVPQ